MQVKYFVGNISLNTDKQGLAAYFAQYGTVFSVSLFRDKKETKSTAFITMDDQNTIVEKGAHNSELDGRSIYIDLKRPLEILDEGASFFEYLTDTPSPIFKINGYISLELFKLIKDNPPYIFEISGRKFEELVAQIVESFGYKVELTKHTRDGGKDIIATLKGEKNESFYIECKKHSPNNLIDVSIIRQFHSVLMLDEINKGIIATSSYFTRDSKLLIERIKSTGCFIETKDNNCVHNWIDIYLDRNNNSGSSFISPPILLFK
jgi:RNA recognition motif-containing protein